MVVDIDYANNPQNWIYSRTPNTAELAWLLLKAKGVQRNMAKFAEECGTSASTFSRVANCKISKALPIELLVEVAKHADNESGVEPYQLFSANGMITKLLAEQKLRRDQDFLHDEEMFSRENEVKNILISNLINRGNQIRQYNQIDDANASRYIKSAGRTGLLLSVDGCEAEFWKFRVINLRGLCRIDDPNHRPNYIAEANMLLSRLAEVFLEDMWNPEKLQICKMSFVFSVREYYDEFNKIVCDKKFNNWFSTILIDYSKRQVIEEFVFERIDGKKAKSPLDYPLMTSDEDSFEDDIDCSFFQEDE